MSSYNNIRKIKYTKTPTDVVSLHEYIMFEDSHAKEKYVVFKFSNNVNQRLFEFKFEVLQYNRDNELIEKSVVVHSNFVAEANDLFVPNAKLKVNFECESLEVRLEEAAFDRVIWHDGEFLDNSYRFEEYAENVTKQKAQPASGESKEKKKKKKHKEKKQYKIGFNIRNISKRNHAAFPAVFNVILSIVFVALIVLSTFYFKQITGAFAVGDFVVKESSFGYVTIVNYSGNEEYIEIPDVLDEKYTVTKIADGAFRRSGIKTVEIKTSRDLTIEGGAFENCSGLVAVVGNDCGRVTLMEGAFTDCKNLKSFEVSTAWLGKKCFDGTHALESLSFDGVLYYNEEGARLLDIFNGLEEINFKCYPNQYYPAEFYESKK